MIVNRTNVSDTKVKLTIAADAAELSPLKDHVLGHFRTKVKIAGFREGKAPLALIEKNVDQGLFQTEFLEEAIQNLYVSAIDQEKIRPVDRPEVQLKKFAPYTDLEFEVEVAVVGEVSLPDYKKIKKTRASVTVSDTDVEEVISSLKKRLADKNDVDRAAKEGDQVWIDFAGVDAKTKEPINGADGKDYPIILGSNTFIPGFEENVIGMGAGDDKTFTITFPEDYGVKALAKRKVTFTVTVTKVQEVAEPEVNDDFAKKAGPFETVEQLKADIKKQVESERQYEADRDYEASIIKDIAEKSKVAIPDSLIEEQIERNMAEFKQNLTYRGQTWQEFLEMEGKTDEEFRSQTMRPQAEERLKASLVLAEIAEKEQIEVTPEELEIRMQMLKSQYQDAKMQAELDKQESRREIASRMITEKTIAKLKEFAAK